MLAIPQKRFEKAVVSFLTVEEIEAILASPDATTWIGRRDRVLLLLLFQTGLRVSELVALRCRDVSLGKGAHVRCLGTGRKERATPLTSQTVAAVRAWMEEVGGSAERALFPSRRSAPLSRDAVEALVEIPNNSERELARADASRAHNITLRVHSYGGVSSWLGELVGAPCRRHEERVAVHALVGA